MSTVKLNTLPAPTFSWLGVNDIQADVGALDNGTYALDNGSCTEVLSGGAYEITAQGGEIREAVMFISPNDSAQVSTTVKAGGSSAVRLVQVFDGKAQTVSSVKALLEDDAGFELVQLYLGTGSTISEIDTQLGGRKSEFTANIGYLLGGDDNLDINLIARHLGKKTKSQITAKGVMNDSAQKTFKGTIDFVSGSAGASGAENEDVLLIGEKVVNKTVPLILCAEEDVEGSHGASIGRVDEEYIFYMQSRGLPQEKIVQLMAQSKIAQIVNTIADEQVRARINNKIGRGKDDE